MTRMKLTSALTILVSLGALTGCGVGSTGTRPAGVTASQAQACRQRTDEVFLQQNRGELYKADTFVSSARDTPYASGTVPQYAGGLAAPSFSAGLGGQYAREKALNDCYNAQTAAPPVAPTKP